MTIKLKKTKLNQIIILGLVLRLLLFVFVALYSEQISLGFIGSSLIPDDVRYEAGARLYASNANQLIDIEAFRNAYWQVQDNVGDPSKSVFETTPLWYWICCVFTYIFKSTWSIRILNILLGCLSIRTLYLFTNEFCDERVSVLVARLMAYMPYQIFFCCFAYKDQFVLFLTFELFYLASVFRRNEEFSGKQMVALILVVLSLMLLRSGMSVFTIIIAVLIGISSDRGEIIRNILRKYNRPIFIVIIIGIIGVAAVLSRSIGTIAYKIAHYQYRYTFKELSDASISFAVINSPSQIWKLPIVFFLSIILPIGRYSQYHTWYGIAASLNYVSIPVMIGNAIYIFKRKFDKVSYYGIMVLYLISAAASINICRHFYSFLPICYIAYADCHYKMKDIEKMAVIAGTLVVGAVLLYHYFG